MIRKTMLLAMLLILPGMANAAEAQKTLEENAVEALLAYCLPVLTAGNETAHAAEAEKLPRMPTEKEEKFLAGKEGKVFGLPRAAGNAVLIAYKPPICSVAVRQLDVAAFLKQVDIWFGPTTPFKLKEEKTLPDGDISREYEALIGTVPINVMVSAHKAPGASGIQAIITAGRISK